MKKKFLVIGFLLMFVSPLYSQVNGKVISPTFSSVSQFVSSSFEASSSSIVLTNRSSYKLEIVNIFPDGINAISAELNNSFQPGESIKIPATKSSSNGVRCFRSIAYKAADFDNENKSKGCELMKLQAKMGKEVCQAINGTNSCFTDAESVLEQNNWCDNSSGQSFQGNQQNNSQQTKSTNNTANDINKSIEDAFNIIKENLSNSQKEEEKENVSQSNQSSNSSNLSSKGMYDKGVYAQYTEQDMNSALYWYTKSANSGYAKAMSTLADFYSDEETANYDKAIGWWLLAYQNKFISYGVLDKILDAYHNNKYLPTDYSNIFSFYTIVVNSEDLFKHLKQNGDQMWAIYKFANFYTFGQGCKTDLKQAFSLHKQNAINGFIPSMIALGLFYKEGYGTTKNYQEAILWLTKAVDNSAPSASNAAMCVIGDMYKDGLGVEKSLEKAKEWYQKSYSAGYQAAKTKLQQLGN